MAIKTHPIFSNFSSGEISPKLDARVDLAQYFNGLQKLSNFICVPQGGVKTRGGFHFVEETKNSGIARLIPFCFSELQNYMLLFGEEYIWFFMNNGFVVSNMFPMGSRDRLTFSTPLQPKTYFHGFYQAFLPRQRTSYIPEPTIAYGNTRFIGTTIPTTLPYQVETPYEIESDLWDIRYDQDDENLYLVHPLYPPMVLTKGVGHTSFVLNEMDFIDGPYEDEITSPTITPSDTTGEITLTASYSLFQPGHVGALWRLNHAAVWSWVKITGVTSPTVATATVMSAVTVAGATTSHREGSWSDVNGWPRAICFHEGKLLFASNFEHPQTIWGSKSGSGNYTDFTPGALDNDAYTFTAADLNIIRWIMSGRALSIGALNAEATAIGPNDGPITAVDPPRIKAETTHGSSNLLAPIKIGKSILFLQKAERKIREFSYSYVEDSYGAPDLTMASEHLFDLDIYALVYQQEPDSILWALRADGVFLPCAYDRSIDPTKGGIVAWSTCDTDGLFEDVGSIPYENTDQVWAIVNRTINGVEKRYVEYYDYDISVDSGLTWDGGPVTILGGLQHLIGKTVKIVGDGAVYPAQVVPESGELTIDRPASKIYVGLGFTPRMVTNRPEVQMASGGSSQGLKKRWNKITVRVLNTTGITINGEVYPAREPADLMDAAPGTYSGDLSKTNLGWGTEGRITIEQPLPLPAHIVALLGTLVVGDD